MNVCYNMSQGSWILLSSGSETMYLPAAATVTAQVATTWIAGGTTFQPMHGLGSRLSCAHTTETRQSCPMETRCRSYENSILAENLFGQLNPNAGLWTIGQINLSMVDRI
jgi:hypothetical protein